MTARIWPVTTGIIQWLLIVKFHRTLQSSKYKPPSIREWPPILVQGLTARRLHSTMQEWPLDTVRLHTLAIELLLPRPHVAHILWSVISSNDRWTCQGGTVARLSIAVSKPHPLLYDLLQLWPHRGYKMKTQKTRKWVNKNYLWRKKANVSRILKLKNSVIVKTLSFIHWWESSSDRHSSSGPWVIASEGQPLFFSPGRKDRDDLYCSEAGLSIIILISH